MPLELNIALKSKLVLKLVSAAQEPVTSQSVLSFGSYESIFIRKT